VYGTSPIGFAACGRTAFFGVLGPVGILSSGMGIAEREGLPWGGGTVPACAPGDEENLEDILDSHEFRRDELLGEGDFPPFIVVVLSVELLLENPGRCGIGFGDDGGASLGC
jgi:hypothetical protein